MKNILVLVHEDEGQRARLQAALDIARAMHGQLTCLDLAIPIERPSMFPVFGGAVVMEPELAPIGGTSARELVEKSGVPFHWLERSGDLGPMVSSGAAQADIVVLSAPRANLFPPTQAAIGDILVHAHKPILSVPPSSAGLTVNGEVLILWDGSREAHAAMVAAIPLLKRATTVTILEIDDGSLKIPATEAAAHLAQREIKAQIRSDLSFGEKAGYVILEQIELLKPSYVVMGGFGHSQFIEGLFGGVTDRLLHESPIPLFLKH
jgi:nucleotide-binding universal stress UspA family protein